MVYCHLRVLVAVGVKYYNSSVMGFDNKKFGKLLRWLRRRVLVDDKQLTQEMLADRLSFSIQQIRKYEAGKDLPSLRTVRGMTEIFNVSGDTILMLDRDPVFSNYDMLTPAHQDQVKEKVKLLLAMEGREWVEPGNSQMIGKKTAS